MPAEEDSEENPSRVTPPESIQKYRHNIRESFLKDSSIQRQEGSTPIIQISQDGRILGSRGPEAFSFRRHNTKSSELF